MAKDYEFTRTRVGKEDEWYKPDRANYVQKVGRPGWAGTAGYEKYDFDKSETAYRRDMREYKEKKQGLKDGTYKYKDNTQGAMEKLRDSGIEADVARAFGSAAGIKVINSLEDARGILNQFGRAQGDYVDEQIKNLNKGGNEEGDSDKDQTPGKNWYDYYAGTEGNENVNANAGFYNYQHGQAFSSAQDKLSSKVQEIASDKDAVAKGKAKQGQYVLKNLGSGTYQS